MPEAAVAAPPTNATPAAAPEAPSGIQAAMKEFEQTVTPKSKSDAKAEPKSEPKTDPKTDSASDPKVEAKVEPKIDPKAKPEDPWDKAPPKLKGEHFKTVRQMQDRIDKLDEQIKQVNSKPKEAPGDAKLIETYQKQIKEMEQRISATDYRQSKEFKTQFIDRWDNEYKATVNEVSKLMVTVTDRDGNATQRAATAQDFEYIRNLPPGEQDKLVQERFGPYANRVFSRLFRLQEIAQSADQAVEEHAKNAETTAKENELKTAKEKQAYETVYESSKAELANGWPQYFGPDESDPEASSALDAGYKYVDEALSKADSMTMEEQAAYKAVIRARAGAFPSTVLKLNRALEELKSLKEELKKYRKSDPGEGGEGGGGAEAPTGDDDVPSGITAASMQF